MAPRKRPETQKTPEVVVRPKTRRSRSPRELEPEAKKLCVKGPGTACACCFNNSAFGGSHAGGWSGGVGAVGFLRLSQVLRMPWAVHFSAGPLTPQSLGLTPLR